MGNNVNICDANSARRDSAEVLRCSFTGNKSPPIAITRSEDTLMEIKNEEKSKDPSPHFETVSSDLAPELDYLLIPSTIKIAEYIAAEEDEEFFMTFTFLPSSVEVASEMYTWKTANEHKEFKSRFEPCEPLVLLGSGQYGDVFKVIDQVTKKYCAQKVVKKSHLSSAQAKRQFESEVSVMERCKHVNLITMLENHETPEVYLITMEFCELGSARDYFKDKIPLSEDHSRHLVGQVLMGVDYLHRQGCIHRDIKLGNILMASPFHVKLIDFGFSKVFPKSNLENPKGLEISPLTNSLNCGTQYMKSPEQLRRSPYGFKIDCWAIGIVTWQLMIGGMPFLLRRKEQIKRAVRALKIPSRVSQHGTDFIESLLKPDADARLAPADALAHQFINDSPLLSDLMENWKHPFNEELVKELNVVQPNPSEYLEVLKREMDREGEDACFFSGTTSISEC